MDENDLFESDVSATIPELDQTVWQLDDTLVENIKRAITEPHVLSNVIEEWMEGIVIVDDKLKVYDANSKFISMLGYARDELLNLHVWDWETQWSEDEIKGVSMNLGGMLVHLKTGHKRKDGSKIDVELLSRAISKDGKTWLLTLCREINDRKRVEEDLRKSRLNLIEIQKISHVGSWELDLNTGEYICSNEMRRIWGFGPDEGITNEKLFQKIHPEDKEFVVATIRNSMEMLTPYDIEYRIIDKGGDIRYLHSKTRIQKNSEDRADRFYGICQDITSRKKDEDQRRLNEVRLLQSQEIAHIGTWEYNLETNELWWSDELYRIFGLDGNDGITPEKYLKFIHPEDRVLFNDQVEEGRENYHFDCRIIPPDGRMRHISTFVGSHEYKDGERHLIRGTAQDITDRKAVEKEKNRLEQQLFQTQKMETIGTLAGGVAHDINNILGIIIGNTELAMDDIPEWNPAYSNLKEIIDAGLRAKEVIRRLLTFSRNMDSKTQIVDIVKIVDEAIKFLRSTISTTIDINKDINLKKTYIIADPSQINQAILNICVNSAQVMEKNGGELTIKVEDISLDKPVKDGAEVLAAGDYIKVIISDNGPGIPFEIRDKIFDPYFTTKEVGKGSGMGLAVVQGIIKKHNGTISVKSLPGEGSEFTILLPGVQRNAEKIDSAPDYPGGRYSILFIDDEASITKIGKRVLEGLGYSVKTETDPQNALEQFQKEPYSFDLIITDMAMPGINALNLYKEIRKINGSIPVILSSGHNPLIDDKKAEEIGFAGYIMKPFTKAELTSIVQKVLENN